MASRDQNRNSKFQEQIKNELNTVLRMGDLTPEFKFASITKVELSRDFSEAKVYWDTFQLDKKERFGQLFGQSKGKLRHHLAKNLNVRHTPNLKFLYDSQFESEMKISKILKESSSDS